jgi:general secretion pathway protein J
MRRTGFTLIEVVVAMFIAAIMFAIGYRALNQAMIERDSLATVQDRITEIQRGMRVVAQDFAQLAARAARDTQSGEAGCHHRHFPRQPGDVFAHRMEQSGRIQRPAEQRVRYRFIDGSLVRDHWLSVIGTQRRPHQRVLTR